MAPADHYSHVELAEEVTVEFAEQGISDEEVVAHLEQGSASGKCRRLLIVSLAVASLVGVVVLQRANGGARPVSEDARSTFSRPASLLAAWSLIPRTKVPVLPPVQSGLRLPVLAESVSCDADIIVQSKFGSERVRASTYKDGQKVPIFEKVAPLADVPCPITYSVACVGGLATLHVENHCQEPPQTVNVSDGFGLQNSFRRFAGVPSGYPKIVSAGANETISFHSGELPTVSNETLQIIATFETCEAIADGGACRQGCCHPGFQCAFRNKILQAWRKHAQAVHTRFPEFLGVCKPTPWTAGQVCKDPSSPGCQALVTNLTTTAAAWQLIITSGGGGGHWSAAVNLATQAKKSWAVTAQAAHTRLQNEGKAVLSEFGLTALGRTMQGVISQRPPVELVDIMDSPCTNLLGAMGLPMGGLMKETWDVAQQSGDVARLKYLFQNEGAVDKIFYSQCLSYIYNALETGDLGAQKQLDQIGPPSRLISTEPMLLPSISEAVEMVMKEGSALSTVDLYMTDLPSEGSQLPFEFWDGIKRMLTLHPERSRFLVVHTVAPISGGAAAIARNCGLDVSQVVIERFLPVNPGFYEGGMPRPRTATEIILKAQLPQEEAFLGGPSRSLAISENDVVVLAMLGSQPTVKAMHTYLEQAKLLRQPPPGSMRYIFLACGPHQKPSYRDLYIALAAKATAMNKDQEMRGLRLRFVPFTGQPAQVIEARAEVTVTRSGGMTAGELLALDARGDGKQVFLHIEQGPGVPPKPPCCDMRAREAWEHQALDAGMMTWEAENAKYLISKVGAQLVTPETFAGMVQYRRSAAPVTK